jgi:hypothetical protein
MTTHFYSPKGGVGCTTIALVHALQRDRPSIMWTTDLVDLAGIAGLGMGDRPEDTVLSIMDLELVADENVTGQYRRSDIMDWGRTQPVDIHPTEDQVWLVVAPCYLHLMKAVRMGIRPTGVILVNEAGRSLRRSDVEAALCAPVMAEVTRDPAVARAVDAGLLVARPPRLLVQQLAPIRHPSVTP